MNKNISALLHACKNLGVAYELYHSGKNLVSIVLDKKRYIFSNWATPLNSQSVMQLCQDKDYFYTYYKDVVKMPLTSSFFNPYSNEKYHRYLEQKTIYEIIQKVEREHSYPLIVKKNRGSWGTNVFKVESRRELERGLLDIFNSNSASFDYIALVQEFIEIEQEYRAIFLYGELVFIYAKVVEGAEFKDNLSPLHWEGAKAQFVKDKEEFLRVENFMQPLFQKSIIPFCGVDIAKDSSGEYWLIEANSSPGFDYIIKHEGEDEVVKLYEKIICSFQEIK